jgi:heme/copper-type cytochrome/quinol oxidase subunit 2
MQGVHEIQVALRKYEFSPGTLHVRKGEQVKLVMAAVDHDHGFRLADFNINQKIPKGRRLSSNSPLTRLALSNFAARMSVA